MKIIKKTCKLALITLLCATVLAFLALCGVNVAKLWVYPEYYGMKTDLCRIPGLNDGFVCQGIAYSEEDERYFISGYMDDGTASRIYVTDENNRSHHVSLEKKSGKAFSGHAGGIAYDSGMLYIANGGRIYTLDAGDVINAKDGATLRLDEGISVNNAASFVYTDGTYLYVGEFHNGENYVTEHPYETASGMQHAIVSRYTLGDLSSPSKIYSIRNKVQGICFTQEGQVVISTSHRLADTVYYVYNEADATYSGQTLDGAPVYYLEDCIREFRGPAMGEDLDYSGGKIITLTESAANKYYFGKFFFADKIVALDLGVS